MMEIRTMKANFSLCEFEEEEEWLSKMHRQGFQLIDISRNNYRFETCQPEDWIYQLDFQSNGTQMSNYIKHFDDYGWEFIIKHNNWCYFRKKNHEKDIDLSIFSDKESKVALCERVMRGRLAINVGLFLISIFIMILSIFTSAFTNESSVLIPTFTWINDFLKAAIPWIGMGLMVATSYSFSNYINIKSKINAMKNFIE